MVDPDEPIFEREPLTCTLRDSPGKGLIDMVVYVRTKDVGLALPKRLEDQAVCPLRAFEEAGHIEAGICSQEGADTRTGRRKEGHVGGFRRTQRRSRRLVHARLDSSVRIGRLQDRLLLVPGALAEHAVEAKPNEQCDEREDNDNGQASILSETKFQHSAGRVKIPTPCNARASIAPHIRGC